MEPYLCLFARSNHPRGWNLAHGYVVIAVSCADEEQVQAVIEHISIKGIRMLDARRIGDGPPLSKDLNWEDVEWYGGPGGSFDHLCTIKGSVDDCQFAGDYRLFTVLAAEEILSDLWVSG